GRAIDQLHRLTRFFLEARTNVLHYELQVGCGSNRDLLRGTEPACQRRDKEKSNGGEQPAEISAPMVHDSTLLCPADFLAVRSNGLMQIDLTCQFDSNHSIVGRNKAVLEQRGIGDPAKSGVYTRRIMTSVDLMRAA